MTLKIQCFFLLGALAGCSGPQPVANSGSATAYKIAYNVAYDTEADDYEIFVMDADGTNIRQLTTGAITEQSPVFVKY